jgi:hypothetical protein
MKVALYQIEQEYLNIVQSIIDAGGEITEEQETALSISKEQLQNKGVCYGFIVKELEGNIDLIDLEIKRLNALKKPLVNSIDRLKNNLSQAMQMFDVTELKTPLLKINFRKSESIEVTDIDLLDADFVKTTITKAADKIAIKEAIKQGENVQGAVLVTNQNLQIK